MNVYLVVGSNCEMYEDYQEYNYGIFSSEDKAISFIENSGFKKDSNGRCWTRVIKDFGDEPQREDFDTEEKYKEMHDYWQDGIDNDEPYCIEKEDMWIETYILDGRE